MNKTVYQIDCKVQILEYSIKIWLPCGLSFAAATEEEAWERVKEAGWEVL